MNDFDKTSVLAFYNSFLKIKLNCDKKENMLILNTCSFQKKMLFNLTCVLIYSLTKCVLEDIFENFVKNLFMTQGLLLRTLQYLESPLFQRTAPPSIIFYRNLRNMQHN